MSTKVHGIIDYIVGIVLLLAPFIFRFSHHEVATVFTIIVGLAVLLQAALTDYEAGIIRRIPMKTHLMVDALVGLLLIVSPWLFMFSETVIWPHVLVGLFVLIGAGATQREPSPEWRAAHHH